MSPIPKRIRELIDKDPFYKNCALYGQHGHACEGRITMEHAIIFAGTQLQELWAIIPLCAHGHGVDQFLGGESTSKDLRIWVALNRATELERARISKAVDYHRELQRLNVKYGAYVPIVPSPTEAPRIPAKTASGSTKNWYFITPQAADQIEKIRSFERRVLGVNSLPRETITQCIESRYLEVRDQLLEEDPELFKMLGFV